MSFDAAVVGSGPNGLAAAVALALAGRRVVVYERGATVGGSARTAEITLPGFRHDLCSAIHPMAAASPFLSLLPLDRHGLRWLRSPAVVAHPFDAAPAVRMVQDPVVTAETLGADRAAYPDIVAPFLAGWTDLARDGLAPLGVPRRPVLMARFGVHAFLPTTVLNATIFRDPRTRAFFAGHAAHSLLPLDRSPSAAVGLMLLLAGHAVGWPFPEGGAQAIPDALAGLLGALGGVVRTGVHVQRLEEVETQGPVVFETGPRTLAAICGDALPAGYRERLARYRYGPGAFKVDWALDGPIPWADPACAQAATVHLGGDEAALVRSERAAWSGEHVDAPFLIVAQPGAFDPTRAPAGRTTAWAYCHVPSGSTVDRTAVIEAQIERFAPGFRDRILARVSTGPAALEAYNPDYVGGDVNGGAADLDQLFTRPVARLDPYSTPNPRIFLGSASTPPGGGVHGMAGWYAARSALGLPLTAPVAEEVAGELKRAGVAT
jgi:phytoene dehydrogenase-like protein